MAGGNGRVSKVNAFSLARFLFKWNTQIKENRGF